MKLEKIVFSAILITLVSMTLVIASHVPDISMSPTQWSADADSDVSLMVSNNGADPIKQVELVIPETAGGIPLYTVKEISEPSGWEYETTVKYGQALPYKIIWEAVGSGIETGEIMSFGFKVTSPSGLGDYTWTVTTIDSKGSSLTNHLTSSTTLLPLAKFEITGEPEEIKAGKTFRITVKAYDKNDDIKTDYTGTVEFGSTDEKALLPESYKFKQSDNGVKSFNIALKTGGEKVVLISDDKSGISRISDIVKVVPGDVVLLKILPDGLEVGATTKVEYIAAASDLYDNSFDVTKETDWSIDSGAGGEWEENFYTAENSGVWTVVGKYSKVSDGAVLKVRGVAKPTPPTVPEVPPTVPEEPVEEEEPTEEEIPVVEPIPTVELTVSGSDTVVVEAGSNETTVIMVENTGNTKLTGVRLSYVGVSEDWIEVYPASEDLEVDESREFLVAITVPENTSETQTVTFTATSNEGASSTKEVTLYAGTGPTGIFAGISKNLLQLAVVIIAVATVVIIVWELWFRK